jgi:hypothetical protein
MTDSPMARSNRYPASLYYWELSNMGGRKLSYGFVPGL